MNENALKKKSSIKIKQTYTGALPKGVGFPRGMDGYIMTKEELYAELRKNGYEVEITDKGVFVSKMITPELPEKDIKMIPEFKELISLIHDHDYDWSMIDEQRRWDEGFASEKRIKELLRGFLWEDIEPHIQENWRREAVKSLF